MKRVNALIALLFVIASFLVSAVPASAKPVEYFQFMTLSCVDDTVSMTWKPILGDSPLNVLLLDDEGNTIADIRTRYGATGVVTTGTTMTIPQAMDAASVIVWSAVVAYPYALSGSCRQTHLFNDGRLDADGAFQSVALYCDGTTLIAYAIFESKGYFAFKLTQDEINEYPDYPDHNVLIKQAKGVRLYRLTTGELQVNRDTPDGKQYSIILDSCVE
jgi:hypothetical protein